MQMSQPKRTDITKPQYGSIPNKNSKDKRVFFQSLRKSKIPKNRPSSFLEFGNTPRREKSSSMNFPRDILRGVYQFSQTINGYTIDSPVFRLNTNATVILLITFSLAVTTRQYVGHPIDCMHARDIPEDVLNTYCWIHSTFIVPGPGIKKEDRDMLSASGIQTTGKKSIKQIRYYQWVEFFLFIQCMAVALNLTITTVSPIWETVNSSDIEALKSFPENNYAKVL